MKRILLIALAAAVLIAGGGYGVFALMSGGGPDPVSLSTASPRSRSSDSLVGTWAVDASESFVGYRVREKLAFLPAPNDAVGRSSAVDGTLRINGLSVEAVEVSADLRELRSDRDMRDRRLRELGLETDQFPEARFVLTTPISFDERPAAGDQVETSARGRLTLHGVTREISVPLQAQWSAGRVEVVGSIPIQFADYEIEQIRLNQVTTEDRGTMEFRLVFAPQQAN